MNYILLFVVALTVPTSGFSTSIYYSSQPDTVPPGKYRGLYEKAIPAEGRIDSYSASTTGGQAEFQADGNLSLQTWQDKYMLEPDPNEKLQWRTMLPDGSILYAKVSLYGYSNIWVVLLFKTNTDPDGTRHLGRFILAPARCEYDDSQ